MYDGMEMEDPARISAAHRRLRDTMLFWMPEEGEYGSTLLHGFTAARMDHAGYGAVAGPSIGLVVQGSRYIEAAGKEYRCEKGSIFLHEEKFDGKSWIIPASPTEPFLSINLEIDHRIIRELLKQEHSYCSPCVHTADQVAICSDIGLLDAYLRLMKLISTPELFIFIAPIIIKEIHYRMLMSSLGAVFLNPSTTHFECCDCSTQ